MYALLYVDDVTHKQYFWYSLVHCDPRGASDSTQNKDAPDLVAFLPGQGLKDIQHNNQISDLVENLAELQKADPVLKVVSEWMSSGSPPQEVGIGYCLTTYCRIFDQ